MKLINKPEHKTALVVGLLAGVINLIIFLLASPSFSQRFATMTFIGVSLLISAIFLTGIYFRAFRREMILSFPSLLKMGLIITGFFLITYETGYYIYIKLNLNEFRQEYIESYSRFLDESQQISGKHFADPKHEETKQKMHSTSPFDFILGDLNIKFLVGSFSSFIIAVILRNTKI